MKSLPGIAGVALVPLAIATMIMLWMALVGHAAPPPSPPPGGYGYPPMTRMP